jgi:hypothetical protein
LYAVTQGGVIGPTLTDVAKRADVALSTASRAFSDPGRLGPDTLRKVLSVAQELGYSPAPRAVEPVSEFAVTVAVVVPDIANPAFSAFVKAAQGQGRRSRHTVVLADTDFNPDREREAIEHLRGRVDGVVVCSSRLDAVVINVGRGPVVDERALYEALRDKVIAGAALDVWYGYPEHGATAPPATLPFRELPNVLMTPHSSGLARQTFAGRAADIAANVRRLAAGQPPAGVVAVAG